LSRFTTEAEIDHAASVVIAAATRLRRAAPQSETRVQAHGFITVARVSNDVVEPKYIPWGKVESRIIVDEKWQDGLSGIETYSHLMIVYWLHHVDSIRQQHVCQGMYDVCPRLGMFASRSPYRVNPIGHHHRASSASRGQRADGGGPRRRRWLTGARHQTVHAACRRASR